MWSYKINPEVVNIVEKGNIFLELKQFSGAIVYYKKAIMFNPEDACIIFNDENCFPKINDEKIFKKLISICDIELKENDENKEILNLKAIFYIYMENYEAAFDLFDKVLAIDSKNIFAVFSKCYNLTYMPYYNVLETLVDNLKGINTDNPMLMLFKARIFNNAYLYQEALDISQRLLDCEKNNIHALYIKSYALCGLGRYDESLELIDEVINKNPDESFYWALKAKCLWESKKDRDEVIKCYDKSIGLNSDNDEVWFEKGMYLMFHDDAGEAVACFKKAFELNPNCHGIEDNETLLYVAEMMAKAGY